MANALSIIRSGNAICEQVVRGKDIVSVGRKVFASGVEMTIAIRVPRTKLKANSVPYLRDLTKLFNQKTAAMLCGVSQSYASRLLRK